MTLVELLIAMALLGVILGSMTTAFITHRRAAVLQEHIAAMTQHALAALELLTLELRNAGSHPTGATFTPVTYSATQLEIRADFNGNGTTNELNEHVIYAYDATRSQITRDAGDGAASLVEHVQAFTFTYLDSTGQPTSLSSAIRQVQITITTRTATPDPAYTANGGHRTFTLTSLITLRN